MQTAPIQSVAPVAVTDFGRADMVATFKRRRAAEDAVLHEIWQGRRKNDYIVRNPDGNICLRFYESEPGVYSMPIHASPEHATTFARRQDAAFIAGRCFNGAGTSARVVDLELALVESIAELDRLLSALGE